MFIIAGFFFPYGALAKRRMARRERQFRDDMTRTGRTFEWQSFSRELEAGRGTLIIELFSFKGPIRRWWTADDIYEKCPFALACHA
jgi:hypothetical protein